MSGRVLWIALALLALLGSAGAGIWVSRGSRTAPAAPLTVSGTLQANPVSVRTQIPGRVRLVAVRPGDVVHAGQLLAWLEAPELREEVRAAEEAVRDAQREVESFRRGRPGGPRETYAQARAAYAAAQRALESAQQLSEEAPSLAQRLEVARTGQRDAAERVAAAEAQVAGAPDDSGALESSGGDPQASSAVSRAEAQATLEKANAAKEAADRGVADLERQLERARAAEGRIATLSAEVDRALAAEDDARARLERATSWETGKEAEEAARRAVRESQALAAYARARLKETLVVAPAAGVVSEVAEVRHVELQAGEALLTLRPLDPLWVEVTVPAGVAAHLRPKQAISLRAGRLPSAAVAGTIGALAHESTDREGPVRVRIAIANPKGSLRPGDAVQISLP